MRENCLTAAGAYGAPPDSLAAPSSTTTAPLYRDSARGCFLRLGRKKSPRYGRVVL